MTLRRLETPWMKREAAKRKRRTQAARKPRETRNPAAQPIHLRVPRGYQRKTNGDTCESCWWRAWRGDELLGCRFMSPTGAVQGSGWCPAYTRRRPR